MPTLHEPPGACPHCGYPINPGICPECGATVSQPVRHGAYKRNHMLRRLVMAGALLMSAFYGGRYAAYEWWPRSQLERAGESNGTLGHLAWDILSYRKKRDHKIFEAACSQIDTAIAASPNHAWAGNYTFGGDIYFSSGDFHLAPDGSFAYCTDGCFGVHEMQTGSARISDDKIDLLTHWAADDCKYPPPSSFVRARWCERHYLIEQSRIQDFCQDVRNNDLLGYLRPPDLAKPIYGLPQLPPKYRQYLPPPPKTATVTWLGKDETRTIDDEGSIFIEHAMRFRLNCGRRDGITVGMKFLRWSDVNWPTITAKTVEDNSCTALYEFTAGQGQPFTLPAIGWQISYRPPEPTSADSNSPNTANQHSAGEELPRKPPPPKIPKNTGPDYQLSAWQ